MDDSPSISEMLLKLIALSKKSDPVARYLAACKTGTFQHPDGRTDRMGSARIAPPQAALLSFLARRCPTPLSVEVGFGMGSSASVLLATRREAGKPFEHVVFDPYGLEGGRGQVVRSYLEQEFAESFRLVKKPSEVGLALLIEERGKRSAGLIFIDGGHRFENVMTDFVLADLLCCDGGHIAFDDAMFPAIETVINYVSSNRPDYDVQHMPQINTAVLTKRGPDRREWWSFQPFAVPDRRDWEPFSQAGGSSTES